MTARSKNTPPINVINESITVTPIREGKDDMRLSIEKRVGDQSWVKILFGEHAKRAWELLCSMFSSAKGDDK